MGSVKDLTVEKEPRENETGIGIFHFTDDYSVFDYGKMPDEIPGKGEALCRTAAYNFKELEKLGIKTHFRRLLKGNEMEVNLVRVLYPQKNEISAETANYLVPLEIIYRNSLPAGSSVFKRLEKGELKFEDLGLDHVPEPGEKFAKPIMDVSTKLELGDRYLNWEEAREMAKISGQQLAELKQTALKINEFLNRRAEEIGLEHADGKVEFAVTPKKELMLVDVFGTLDEDRMLFHNMHISKQVLRDYYKTLPWANEMISAKESGKPKETWPKPPKLPKELIEIVSNMYKSVCEAWINERIWNAPSIGEVVDSYKNFLDGLNK
ncbi:MAG: phosphoribosylaminoimidazolesuccinocarboxamide synthase [Candidatus Diapherotrites archaeon]|uniref:Phosphoribosylaminoimidazole-succinocarboxamide synthase n=1 Tax=Candidatus Iainarchaeum sp. TaxID=3101447 RepID=A0A8T4KVQ9_9ARCH|nr:phosphoribosylaminoimidazolesuccinocarboxamide synthase [Candidatus Diapherotrites archaeon]